MFRFLYLVSALLTLVYLQSHNLRVDSMAAVASDDGKTVRLSMFLYERPDVPVSHTWLY